MQIAGLRQRLHVCVLDAAFGSIKACLTAPCSAFTLDAFHAAFPETFRYLREDCAILVVGVGGLGCEILKCLVLTGFTQLSVIDQDTISLSNLSRQLLFGENDIGKFKAHVAADYLNSRYRVLSVNVKPYVGRIQDQPPSFYRQFNVIVAGLDNIEARRWLNSLLHSTVVRDPTTGAADPNSITPFFDGGTEGYRGQCRTILPSRTSCFECSLDAFPADGPNYPLCTVVDTPRRPEHCIEYAFLVEWSKTFGNTTPDLDDPIDLQWLYNRAQERAKQYDIEGVTYALTLGITKRIIPAVVSTNALIAAGLVVEIFKLSTYCAPVLDTYLMYMGDTGVYSYVFRYARKQDCLVCSATTSSLAVRSNLTLDELLVELQQKFQIRSPSIATRKSVIYMQNPPALREQHKVKLTQTLEELITEGYLLPSDQLVITDPTLDSCIYVQLSIGDVAKHL